MTQKFFTRHGGVYFYVPNLIGYFRLLCSLLAFAVAMTRPKLCVALYFTGFVCDELDGRFARLLKQTSTLGIVLDMVTDRLATAGLLMILSLLYPRWYMACVVTLMLDILSHWMHMYASLLTGSETHKDVHSRNIVVRVYYRYRVFMGICCICCEVLYLALYLQHWQPRQPALSWRAPQWSLISPASFALAALPGWAIKQGTNLEQLRSAAAILVDHDVRKGQASSSAGKSS